MATEDREKRTCPVTSNNRPGHTPGVAYTLADEVLCISILLAFVAVLSFPVLRDLDNLPTRPNVDAYQHLAFAYSFYDAVSGYGELPLWNPYFGGGIPWAGYFYNPGLSPFALVYALAGEVAGFKICLMLALLLGGIGMYGVCRRIALLSPWFSLFAALLFLSSTWIAGRVDSGNYNEFSEYFWIFALLCFHEMLYARAWGFLFPLYFVIALNPAKYAALTTLIAGLVVVLCARAYRGRRGFAVSLWFIGALIGLLMSMPKILPMIELLRLNLVNVHALKSLEGYSLERIFWRLGSVEISNLSFSVGLLGLGLALAGMLMRWKDGREWIALFCIGSLFALGEKAPSPVSALFAHTPLFSSISDYGKYFSVIILTATCVLAALGLQGIYQSLSNRIAWNGLPAAMIALACAALLPPLIATYGYLNGAFRLPQPNYERGPFYQVSYADLIGKIAKPRPSLHDDDQYANVRRNIGTITWNGNIVLKENAIPKFIITTDGERLNPDYRGEAVLIGPNAGQGKITQFVVGYNTIKVRYTADAPQTILLNFNYNPGWTSNAGRVENHNGLLSLNVSAGSDNEILLTFRDKAFILGCCIAVAGAMLYVLLYTYLVGRSRRPANAALMWYRCDDVVGWKALSPRVDRSALSLH